MEEEYKKIDVEIEAIMKKSRYNALDEFINVVLLDIRKLGNSATANKYGISLEDVEKIHSNYKCITEEPISDEIIANLRELSKKVDISAILERFNNIKGNDEYINNQIEKIDTQIKELEDEAEYEKYAKLYKEKFGKKAFIANPSGSKEQTVEAIKVCLEKNEDLLGEILNPNVDGRLY